MSDNQLRPATSTDALYILLQKLIAAQPVLHQRPAEVPDIGLTSDRNPT